MSGLSSSLPERLLLLPRAALTVDAVRAAEAELVGSEAILDRVAFKLARLQVDPFFYQQQMELYQWRGHLLDCFSRHWYDVTTEEGHLLTQRFPELLHDLLRRTRPRRLVPNRRVAREAAAKFYMSAGDSADSMAELAPPALVRRAIRCLHRRGAPSLLELGCRRVLELRLPQGELPRGLRALLRAGPPAHLLSARGEQLLQELEQVEGDYTRWLAAEAEGEEYED
jgi:hypothetical protein